MTTFRKTTGGYAFNIVSGAMVGRDPAIIAWIDSLPPLEPVVKTDSDPFTPSKICDEDRDAIRRMLGAIEPEATVHVVRRVVSELAEVKSRAASVTTDNMQLRAFFDEVGVMLGIKSRDGVTKGEIRVAIEALKSDVVRAGNACFDATARLQKMERELAEAKRDTERLDWLSLLAPWDGFGGIDINERASEYAEANGRDEPSDADFAAALRDQLDEAMKGEE